MNVPSQKALKRLYTFPNKASEGEKNQSGIENYMSEGDIIYVTVSKAKRGSVGLERIRRIQNEGYMGFAIRAEIALRGRLAFLHIRCYKNILHIHRGVKKL